MSRNFGNDRTSSNDAYKDDGDQKKIVSMSDMNEYLKQIGEKLNSPERNSEWQNKCGTKFNQLPGWDEQETTLGEDLYEEGFQEISQDDVHHKNLLKS